LGNANTIQPFVLTAGRFFSGVRVNGSELRPPASKVANPDIAFGQANGVLLRRTNDIGLLLVVCSTFLGGVQASPIFQASSAKPYTSLAGRDCNGDGQTNDRAFLDASGNLTPCNAPGSIQQSVNSRRGQASYNLDARLTKFFNLPGETRKFGLFAEFCNITNRANFGNSYNNNVSTMFRQPTGFIANGYALPTSRQFQLEALASYSSLRAATNPPSWKIILFLGVGATRRDRTGDLLITKFCFVPYAIDTTVGLTLVTSAYSA
jgi:hypothetical protein